MTTRLWMVAVAVVGLVLGGIVWMTRGACLNAMVINSSGSAIANVRLTYLGTTRIVGNLAPWQAYSLGRHGYGWTRVTVSYVDGRGRQVSASLLIGVDLRRPVKSDGDDGQAVIDVRPSKITTDRWYWFSW
jgi:hypothetical protein